MGQLTLISLFLKLPIRIISYECMYDETLRVDQYNVIQGLDLLLDDAEEAELPKTKMPVTDGISRSLKRLMEDPQIQEKVEAIAQDYRETWERFGAQSAV
jgi:hypothetical protein